MPAASSYIGASNSRLMFVDKRLEAGRMYIKRPSSGQVSTAVCVGFATSEMGPSTYSTVGTNGTDQRRTAPEILPDKGKWTVEEYNSRDPNGSSESVVASAEFRLHLQAVASSEGLYLSIGVGRERSMDGSQTSGIDGTRQSPFFLGPLSERISLSSP